MILGVGIDVVEVARMENILNRRWAYRFIFRVFSQEEIAASKNSANPAQAYAARFAAKEAFVKALGTGFSCGISPSRIQVRGGDRNRPWIELTDEALKNAESMNVGTIHVSMSHTPLIACAVVILEKSFTKTR